MAGTTHKMITEKTLILQMESIAKHTHNGLIICIDISHTFVTQYCVFSQATLYGRITLLPYQFLVYDHSLSLSQ